MTQLIWPDGWQDEAIAAAEPYVGTDERLDILVGDPTTSRSGTLMGGHVYCGEDGAVMVIHDRSGRPDVYPWRLLAGPVLVLNLLRPRRRALELYRHPDWPKIPGRL